MKRDVNAWMVTGGKSVKAKYLIVTNWKWSGGLKIFVVAIVIVHFIIFAKLAIAHCGKPLI